MPSDLDLWRSALLAVKRYGDDAAFHASSRADELMAKGDLAGCRAWIQILVRIDELLAMESQGSSH